MALQNNNGINYWQFESFPDAAVGHGIFGRQGGVSPVPWSSLNLGGTVGDAPDNIIENRRLIFECVQRPLKSLYDVWQVHSADVVYATGARSIYDPHIRADAILTDNPAVTLVMRFADCVPILLYDPIHRAVGLVHAGWQGTVKFIAQHAVSKMTACFGSRPADLLAGIGPSIGPDHYEVGNDVITQVKKAFGPFSTHLLEQNGDHAYLNLWEANKKVLELSGINQIEIAKICTACHSKDWFSHRAEKGKTGRFAAVLFLREKKGE